MFNLFSISAAPLLITIVWDLLTLYLTLFFVMVILTIRMALFIHILIEFSSYWPSVCVRWLAKVLWLPFMYLLYYLAIRLVLEYQLCISTPFSFFPQVLVHILNTRYFFLPTALAQELDQPMDGLNAEKWVQFKETRALNKGILGLNNMYNWLPEESDLKLYLNSNATFLLNPLTGNTPIMTSALDITTITSHPFTVNLDSGFSLKYTHHSDLLGSAGVYVFVDKSSGQISQCGSCINWTSRLALHYQDAKKSSKAFYSPYPSVGLEAYLWHPICITVNFVTDYLSANNLLASALSREDTYILRSFTQQYIRSIEQALSSHCLPTYWGGVDINTWHNKWVPGYSVNAEGEFTVWIDQNGKSDSATSMRNARPELGISHFTISRVANCIPTYWCNTPKWGKVSILIESRPEQPLPKIQRLLKAKPDTDFDYSCLPYNKVFLVDETLNVTPYGPYDTVADANEEMGFDRKYKSRRYLNKLHLINSPALNEKFYLVSNKSRTAYYTPVTLVEVHENGDDMGAEPIKFNAIAAAERFLFAKSGLRTYKLVFAAIVGQSIITSLPDSSGKGKTYIVNRVNPEQIETRLRTVKAITRERNQRHYAKIKRARSVT